MGLISRTSFHMEPRVFNRQYFYVSYAELNYNDTTIYATFPSELEADPNVRVVVTDIAVYHAGAVGVTMEYVRMYTGLGSQLLDNHTTTSAKDVWSTRGLFIPIVHSMMSAGDKLSWFRILYLAGYGAADDINVFIRGYIEHTEAPPVTLDGYRWPLRRS